MTPRQLDAECSYSLTPHSELVVSLIQGQDLSTAAVQILTPIFCGKVAYANRIGISLGDGQVWAGDRVLRVVTWIARGLCLL